MYQDKSQSLFARALRVMPGGVNSPVRAFKNVGGTPKFFEAGEGPYLIDVDGSRYIDFVASWGPMLQGYGFSPVVQAVLEQAQKTTSFGAPSEPELQLAEEVVARVSSIEKVRMVNSGTEATMSAIRLARGVTGRDKVVKFEGCYHGHSDSLLVKAGSGVLTLGLPDSPGVPVDLARDTLTLPYNDVAAFESLMSQHGEQIAAVIVEPIAGNMGCIPPLDGFLVHLRESTREHGCLLIFDEVMTGFRVAKGGAQELYNVSPDITTLGKVIGGGLPVGAFGGAAKIMDQLAPQGNIYQAGTLSGNPLAMAAGLALLRSLDDRFYAKLKSTTTDFCQSLKEAANQLRLPLVVQYETGMFSLFFTNQESVRNYQDVCACDTDLYRRFFHQLLNRGVYFAPSPYESAFMSGSHDDETLANALASVNEVLVSLA